VLRDGGGGLMVDDPVVGDLSEHRLRLLLEESFRSKLAAQARRIEDYEVLVDLANAVRPRTLT
jgi:hypothetical protein